jgi:hypothetical protein
MEIKSHDMIFVNCRTKTAAHTIQSESEGLGTTGAGGMLSAREQRPQSNNLPWQEQENIDVLA